LNIGGSKDIQAFFNAGTRMDKSEKSLPLKTSNQSQSPRLSNGQNDKNLKDHFSNNLKSSEKKLSNDQGKAAAATDKQPVAKKSDVMANDVIANKDEVNSYQKEYSSAPLVAKKYESPVAVQVSNEGDTSSVSPVEQMELLESAAQKPVITEKAVMVQFLLSMKNELGVDPEKIVEAMANLDEDQLLKAPEETMSLVLGQLGLNANQRVRAEELYSVMLKDSATASMQESLIDSGKNVDFKVMGPEESGRMKLSQSLDKMNQNFFVGQNPKALQGSLTKEESALLSQMQSLTPKDADTLEKLKDTILPPQPQMSESQAKESQFAAKPAAVGQQIRPAAAGLESLYPWTMKMQAQDQIQDQQDAESTSVEALALGSELPASTVPVASKSTAEKIMSMPQWSFAQVAQPTNASRSELDYDSGEDLGSSRDNMDSAPYESVESADSNPLNFQQAVGKQTQTILPTTTDLRPGTPQISNTDDSTNIRELIQGAQILVQKGGGEMKIQMRPEGLGSVDLIVGVKDGKVDIQMTAESSETKRLLEAGMDDLKASLVHHKLNLETVKVDAGSQAGTGSDAGFLNQDRESAREFLGQFREFNQSRRDSMNDFFDVSGYGNPRSRRMTPENTPTTSSKVSTKRLDLVA